MILRKRGRGGKIDKLYDSFKVKDMGRLEFRRRYLALMNPKLMQRDLGRIQGMMQVERLQRGEINKRLKGV